MSETNINYIYLIRCSNNSLYGGYTNDMEKRYQDHLDGNGAKYTKAFKPLALAVSWKVHGNKSDAMKLEYFLKKQSKADKELFCINPELFLNLAKAEFEKITLEFYKAI